MNDAYKEILVRRQNTAANGVKKAAVTAGVVLLAAAGLLIHPLLLLAAAAFGVFAWFFVTGLNLEYEYLYINGDIDVDKIMNKQRRKKAGSYALDDLEIIAPAGSHDLDSYRSRSGAVTKDYSSGNAPDRSYTAVYSREGRTELVTFEFGPEVIADLRRLAPRKLSRDCLLLRQP